jgi:hypothetical protein
MQIFDGALIDLPGNELACQGDVEQQMRQIPRSLRKPRLRFDDVFFEGDQESWKL